jgi:hypothetical protein
MALSREIPLKQGEFWALLFFMGLVMLNWPILALASRGPKVLSYPFILVYIVAVWWTIIIFLYIFGRRDSE